MVVTAMILAARQTFSRRLLGPSPTKGMMRLTAPRSSMDALRPCLGRQRQNKRQPQQSQYKDCGTGHCQHWRMKSQCRDCGTGYCVYGHRKGRCKDCGAGYCQHGRRSGGAAHARAAERSTCQHGRRIGPVKGMRHGPLQAREPERQNKRQPQHCHSVLKATSDAQDAQNSDATDEVRAMSLKSRCYVKGLLYRAIKSLGARQGPRARDKPLLRSPTASRSTRARRMRRGASGVTHSRAP
jgi:hypothetical protein